MRTGGSDPNQHHVSLLFVMTGWRDDLGGGCANQNSGKAAPVNQPLLPKPALAFPTNWPTGSHSPTKPPAANIFLRAGQHFRRNLRQIASCLQKSGKVRKLATEQRRFDI